MPRPAVIPIPELAVAFIEAVEEGRPPVQDMSRRFGLTYEQAEARSWRLRKGGWLPAGWYTREGWLTEAKQRVSDRLDVLAERELAQQAKLQARVRRARSALARERAAMFAPPRQVRIRPARPAHQVNQERSVLDLFG